MKKYSNRNQSLLEFITLLVVVVVANILANVYYQRVDLTSEERYTLSETSKKLANGLKEKLYVNDVGYSYLPLAISILSYTA